MFIIEDEIHAELCGEFSGFSEASAELQARSQMLSLELELMRRSDKIYVELEA